MFFNQKKNAQAVLKNSEQRIIVAIMIFLNECPLCMIRKIKDHVQKNNAPNCWQKSRTKNRYFCEGCSFLVHNRFQFISHTCYMNHVHYFSEHSAYGAAVTQMEACMCGYATVL